MPTLVAGPPSSLNPLCPLPANVVMIPVDIASRRTFFFSSRRRHTRSLCDWSSDVCSSDLIEVPSFLDGDGKEQEGTECPGGLDFTAPDSAVALRMVSSSRGFSRFYYSKDRSEERRVGKECSARRSGYASKQKQNTTANTHN